MFIRATSLGTSVAQSDFTRIAFERGRIIYEHVGASLISEERRILLDVHHILFEKTLINLNLGPGRV